MGFISPIATDTNGKPKTTGGMQQLGRDDFMKLLVTKLENQDPLKPMDDEDFIAQLAQFATLEQMHNISEGISSSNQWDLLQMQSLNNAMASSLIGKEITASFEGVMLNKDDSATIAYTSTQPLKSVVLTIKDSAGQVVSTLVEEDISVGTHSIEWDGTDLRGNRLAEGYYTVQATATTNSGEMVEPSLNIAGTVERIYYRDGNAYLYVSGSEVALADVTAIGMAGSFNEN